MVVNPGETITLVCVASGGDPRPALSWVRPRGEDLPKRSVVNGGTLTIPAVTVEEGGAYTCLASNNVGSPVKKSVSVLVRGTAFDVLCVCLPLHTLLSVLNVSGGLRQIRKFQCLFVCSSQSSKQQTDDVQDL